MDAFIEQIVNKKKNAGDWAVIVGVVLAGIVLVLAFWLFMPPMVLFAVAGAAFGGWWLISGRNKEFEYCVTNGDIDIDLIVAKRQRQRLVSVAGRKVESLLPYTPGTSTVGFQRVVMAAPSLQVPGLWCFTYNSKKNGRTFVVFQPQQRVLQALYGGLPKLVQMDTRRVAKEVGLDELFQ